MKIGELFAKVPWTKVGKVASCGVAVGAAVISALSDQKKAEEFEQLKKDVAALKDGKS